MNDLVVREYQWIEIKTSPGEGGSLSQDEALVLERLSVRYPAGVLEWKRSQVRVAGFCGIIPLKLRNLEVLPKVTSVEEDTTVARQVFLRMLQSVFDLPVQETGQSSLDLEKNSVLDVLIMDFCRTLARLSARGLIHQYVEQQDLLPIVRGKINVTEQLRNPGAALDALVCDFQEFEANNLYNRIIKSTLLVLLKLARSSVVRNQIVVVSSWFGDVSPLSSHVIPWDSLLFQRQIEEWRPLFTFCRWFLEGTSLQQKSGREIGLSFLFEMNLLFEVFFARELRAVLRPLDLIVLAQQPRKYLVTNPNDDEVFQMKPDVTVLRNQAPFAIFDTKWKVLDGTKKKGVSQADLYQMYAYARVYGIERIALVYPSLDHPESDPWRYNDDSMKPVELWILRVDLRRLAQGKENMRQHLKQLCQAVLDS